MGKKISQGGKTNVLSNWLKKSGARSRRHLKKISLTPAFGERWGAKKKEKNVVADSGGPQFTLQIQ